MQENNSSSNHYAPSLTHTGTIATETNIQNDEEKILATVIMAQDILSDFGEPRSSFEFKGSLSLTEMNQKVDDTEEYLANIERIHVLRRSRSFAPEDLGIFKEEGMTDSPTILVKNQSEERFKNSLIFSILEGVASNIDTMDSENAPVCRICHGSSEDLQYLCECKGTMGPVHTECLTHWLSESGRSCCEICNVPYKVKRILRRPVMEILIGWLFNVVKNNQVFIILSWLMAITPIILLSSAVCVFCLKQIFLTSDNVRALHPALAFFTFTCSLTLVVWYYDMLLMISRAYYENWHLYYIRDHEIEIIIPNVANT